MRLSLPRSCWVTFPNSAVPEGPPKSTPRGGGVGARWMLPREDTQTPHTFPTSHVQPSQRDAFLKKVPLKDPTASASD